MSGGLDGARSPRREALALAAIFRPMGSHCMVLSKRVTLTFSYPTVELDEEATWTVCSGIIARIKYHWHGASRF